ncbi:helix-turn-helix domain-containing protein [Gottfriedia acidiceleris]|uniref:helix-turn-helix domain-containing protein n=1 Tax=Gottfriedia acidiceleris TaxID=371036 RepID=UPI002FFF5230
MIQEAIERRENMDFKDENIKSFNFSKAVSLPKEYYMIDKPKQHIAKAIKFAIGQKNLSLRKLSERIDKMSYPQLSRVTRKENYNIETLLKILDALDLEIEIKPKNIEQ